MGLSTSLLVLAVIAALVPAALVGPRPPERIRDLEKVVVSGFLIVVIGAIVINGFHDLSFFGIVHLLYLLVFVTLPLVLGVWYLLSLRAGRRRVDSIYGALAALIAVVGLYGTHVEPQWLRVDEVTVTADVPSTLRVGVVADLQTPSVGDHERDAIATVLSRNPDIVVIPGDFFQGSAEQLEAERSEFVGLLRQLVDGSQIVAVTSGDSDWSIPLRPMVEEAGAFFIDDTVLAFSINGMDLRLAGVRVAADGPARANALATLNDQTDALSLLVAHRPDVVYELGPTSDVDLVISGHTHGGQVQIPFFGPPITFSDVPRDLAAGGLGIVNDIPLYVSAGVGLERLQAPQVRIGARPEVGIIDIVPAN